MKIEILGFEELCRAHPDLTLVLIYLFGSLGAVVGAVTLHQEREDGSLNFVPAWQRFRTGGDFVGMIAMCLLPPGVLMGYFVWVMTGVMSLFGTLYGIVWLVAEGPSWLSNRRMTAIERKIDRKYTK